MSMLNLVAVDLGASSGRVMQAGFTGDQLTLREVRRFPNSPTYVFDRMYWNAYGLLDQIKQGIMATAAAVGVVDSIGVDSWAVDFGLVDKRGVLLDAPRHYRDARNPAAMQAVLRQVGAASLFDRTGIQLLPFNTLFQLWAMQEDNPALLAHADTLLLMPDLLNYFLTGEAQAEFTNATTTQMLDAQSASWDTQLLTQLHLPTGLLPPIAQPGTVLGRLNDLELLAHAGLANTQVVHTTSHDTAAAVVSVPAEQQECVYISSGTWSLLGTLVQRPILNDVARTFNFTNEGGVGNYRLLKNVMGLWLLQETQRNLQNVGEPADIQRLLHGARLASRFTALFNPDDPRLLQPGDMPAAIRQMCVETGQRPPQTTGELVRGILESLALKYRMVLEQLEVLTDRRYQVIHVVGGGSQNELLCQFTANATGRTVIAGPVEASAIGNVLVQLVALGELSTGPEMLELVRRSAQPVPYVPRDKELWDQAYRLFGRLTLRQMEKEIEHNGKMD